MAALTAAALTTPQIISKLTQLRTEVESAQPEQLLTRDQYFLLADSCFYLGLSELQTAAVTGREYVPEFTISEGDNVTP